MKQRARPRTPSSAPSARRHRRLDRRAAGRRAARRTPSACAIAAGSADARARRPRGPRAWWDRAYRRWLDGGVARIRLTFPAGETMPEETEFLADRSTLVDEAFQ